MPKKSLGQHFLIDKGIIKWIMELVPKDKMIVEIGPGRGALTSHLKPESTILFEMDRELVSFWSEKGFKVIEGDAVQTIPKFFNENPDINIDDLFFLSNLPYNASTQIFVELMRLKVPHMLLMFQKEVGQKINADYGESNFGRLSIISKIFYDVKRTKSVRPKAFYPPPNVESILLFFERKKEFLVNVPLEDLEIMVKNLFQFPRKKLKASGVNYPPITEKRGHELQEKDWIELLNFLNSVRNVC